MKEIKQKNSLISRWIFQTVPAWAPALADYIKQIEKQKYGAYKINIFNRQQLAKECMAHIEYLLVELHKRFAPSHLLESMSVLFDPAYLIGYKKDIHLPNYGRSELGFIRNKYQNFPGFDRKTVHSEWEKLKPSMSDFLDRSSSNDLHETFWKQFLLLQQSVKSRFLKENSNLLVLLNIYLIAPTKSAECE